MDRSIVARELARIAEELSEDNDPKFVEKVRTLKMLLPKLTQKKGRALRQFGITEVIRPTSSVEDIIDLLISVGNQ